MALFIVVTAFVYVCVRLFYSLFPRLLRIGLIITTALACFYESLLGLFQLLGIHSSNSYLYTITGSFDNPGPYGGFLAVCISLLGAYYYESKCKDENKSFVLKFIHLSILLITITAFVILPSTQSRSAIISLGCGILLYVVGNNTASIIMKQLFKKYGLWMFVGVVLCITVAYFLKKPSADSRFYIDKIAIKAIYENGWKGAGVGHFGGAYGEAQAKYFKKQIDEKGKDDLDWRVINEKDFHVADCPDNAFNEFLFIGVEAGPIVMVLFAGIVATAIIVSFKRRTIWCYGLMTFIVFSLFSYPLHIIQFKILFPIVLALCISDNKPTNNTISKDSYIPIYKNKARLITITVSMVIIIILSITVT